MDAAFVISIKTRHDRTELQSSFHPAANSEASWFFCSVIGLSFFETAVSKSWLDSSSQHASTTGAVSVGTRSDTPRRVAQLFI
jgi:hypothetical protein